MYVYNGGETILKVVVGGGGQLGTYYLFFKVINT